MCAWQTQLIFENWVHFAAAVIYIDMGCFVFFSSLCLHKASKVFIKCLHESSFRFGQTAPKRRHVVWLATPYEARVSLCEGFVRIRRMSKFSGRPPHNPFCEWVNSRAEVTFSGKSDYLVNLISLQANWIAWIWCLNSFRSVSKSFWIGGWSMIRPISVL